MQNKLLGLGAFIIYGAFGDMSIGARVAQAQVEADPEEMILEEMNSEGLHSQDIDPAYKEVRCLIRGSFDCMAQCVSIGANCSQFVLHPKRSDGGVGSLYWCKGGSWPTYTCSYRFPNGEHCHFVRPIGRNVMRV